MAFDPTLNANHVISIAAGAGAFIGTWAVFQYRMKQSEKDRERLGKRIDEVEQTIAADRLHAAQSGPVMLCSLHEQRITKLEEEINVRFLKMDAKLDMILARSGYHPAHPPEA